MKIRVTTAAAVAIAAVCLSGCASVIEGTSQEIKVVTNPPGANCAFEREGSVIARVDQTPGAVTIKKTKHDITLKCSKPGYQEGTYLNHSGAAGATFGSMRRRFRQRRSAAGRSTALRARTTSMMAW